MAVEATVAGASVIEALARIIALPTATIVAAPSVTLTVPLIVGRNEGVVEPNGTRPKEEAPKATTYRP